MRERWQRHEGELTLDAAEVSRLVRAAVPKASVIAFRPAIGGLSNTNIEVELARAPHRILLRLYQRDLAAAEREAAINSLVLQQGVPTARFLHVGDRDGLTGQPYAVLEWIAGSSFEGLMTDLATGDLRPLGRSLGRILASIHAVGFDRAGFFDGRLRIAEPIELGAVGLLAYLRQCLIEGDGAKRLGRALTAALIGFVEREGSRLDGWLGQSCLTHADFNPSNILLDPGKEGHIAAVLDWEFAFSGSPAFDFGNLLRPPLGRHQGFVHALAEAYREAGGYLPADWRTISRLADLYAWADFLNRPNAGAELIKDARGIIRDTIQMV